MSQTNYLANFQDYSSPLLIIGDVHCKINRYSEILKTCWMQHHTIQVGDFGFKKEHQWHLDNIDNSQHHVNFGNHDDYTYLDKAHSLGDFSISKSGIMTVRGADSIDKYRRIENRDWWPNEELNYDQMQKAIDAYILTKPKIMITHNCPREVSNELFGKMEKSITTNGLQAMLEYHQPDLWVFGHHHKSKNEVINGTRFVCLAELETLIV